MAVKQWTVVLEDHERDTLHAAVDGRPIEYVLRRLRAEMTTGRDTVNELAKSKESITADQITAARQALITRRELLTKMPTDAELIQSAIEPIDAGITECDRILRDELGMDYSPITDTSVTGSSYAPAATAGQQ